MLPTRSPLWVGGFVFRRVDFLHASTLSARPDTDDFVVHRHAPRYAQGLTVGTIPAFDALGFMVHTTDRARTVAFAEDYAQYTTRIQQTVRLPPEGAAEEMNPAAQAMTAIAERMGI